MTTRHEQPGLSRLELVGKLASAARLALLECEHADGVILHITASDHEIAIDCTYIVEGAEVHGWGE